MLNRQYQIRATRQAMRDHAAEQLSRPPQNQSPTTDMEQLALFEPPRISPDATRPLEDVFPEAYE